LPTVVSAAATATQSLISSTTSYDDFGRVISYSDNDQATGALANTTTTAYGDTTGLVNSTTDAHSTMSYTYNQGGENRGLATTMTDSAISGSFTAIYNSDGTLVSEMLPNGVVESRGYNETGTNITLSDTANGRTWLAEQVSANSQDQIVTDNYTAGSNYGGGRVYTYDADGRLTQTNDTLSNSGAPTCTVRQYGFDVDSNRTSSKTYNPAANGSCQSTTAATSLTHTYDIADRLQATGTDAGLAYDAFGRITNLPSADTGNAGGAATLSYYANDLVRTEAQVGTTMAYRLDASGRLNAHTSSAGGSWTNHYDDASSDSPDWIAENAAASNYTRNVTGLDGQLVATVDQGGTVTWQISNLHGDTVATAVATDLEPSTYFLTDEFGSTISGYTTASRYGWLGGKQRAHDDLAGLVLMGQRLYDPVLGRFLSVDPFPGASASAYDYCGADPVNCQDVSGDCPWCVAALPFAAAMDWNPIGWVITGAIALGGTAYLGYEGYQAYERDHSAGVAPMAKRPARNKDREGHKGKKRKSTKQDHEDAQGHGGRQKPNFRTNPNKRTDPRDSEW
jgi:RHS repeat-associated protein